MLMHSDYAAINHQIVKIRIIRHRLKNANPYTFFTPAMVTNIHSVPIPKVVGQITPEEPVRIIHNTALTNKRLLSAVTPQSVDFPGKRHSMRLH
jgi:hypothetical protein